MIYALGEHEPELTGDGQFIADGATIIGKVRLLDSASIWFGCVRCGLTEAEVGSITASATRYVDNASRYRERLRPSASR